MTYQNIPDPAQVLNREINMTRNVVERVSKFFSAVGHALASVGHALMTNSTGQQRMNRIAYLQSKTDAELAELNIKRDDIVHYVFKDLYYV